MFKAVLTAVVFSMSVHAHAADQYTVDTKASKVAWKGTKKWEAHITVQFLLKRVK